MITRNDIIELISAKSNDEKQLLADCVLSAMRASLFAEGYIGIVLKSAHFRMEISTPHASENFNIAWYNGALNRVVFSQPYIDLPATEPLRNFIIRSLLHEFWHAFLTILHVHNHDIYTFPRDRNTMELSLPVLPITDKEIAEIKNLLDSGKRLLGTALDGYIKKPLTFKNDYPKLAAYLEKHITSYVPRSDIVQLAMQTSRMDCKEQASEQIGKLSQGKLVQHTNGIGLPVILVNYVSQDGNLCQFSSQYGNLQWTKEQNGLFAAFLDLHYTNEFERMKRDTYIARYRAMKYGPDRAYGIKPEYFPHFLMSEEEAGIIEMGGLLPLFFAKLLERHWQDFKQYASPTLTNSPEAKLMAKFLKRQSAYQAELQRLSENSIPLTPFGGLSTRSWEIYRILDRRVIEETQTSIIEENSESCAATQTSGAARRPSWLSSLYNLLDISIHTLQRVDITQLGAIAKQPAALAQYAALPAELPEIPNALTHWQAQDNSSQVFLLKYSQDSFSFTRMPVHTFSAYHVETNTFDGKLALYAQPFICLNAQGTRTNILSSSGIFAEIISNKQFLQAQRALCEWLPPDPMTLTGISLIQSTLHGIADGGKAASSRVLQHHKNDGLTNRFWLNVAYYGALWGSNYLCNVLFLMSCSHMDTTDDAALAVMSAHNKQTQAASIDHGAAALHASMLTVGVMTVNTLTDNVLPAAANYAQQTGHKLVANSVKAVNALTRIGIFAYYGWQAGTSVIGSVAAGWAGRHVTEKVIAAVKPDSAVQPSKP